MHAEPNFDPNLHGRSPRTFPRSVAFHVLKDGYEIRTVQEVLGQRNVKTMMIDTHVFTRGDRGIRSPPHGVV